MAVTTNIPGRLPGSAAIQTNGLRDIKPPIEIPNAWRWAMWIFVAALVAALLWWLYRNWQKKKAQIAAKPPVPAHIRACQRLDEALGLIEEPKPFCTEVSDTIRSYLEERFSFHAPDRTTGEFLHELRNTNLLTSAQKESLGDFLQQCDLVKFAKYEPAQDELRNLHGSAVRLVNETEPVPVNESVNQ